MATLWCTASFSWKLRSTSPGIVWLPFALKRDGYSWVVGGRFLSGRLFWSQSLLAGQGGVFPFFREGVLLSRLLVFGGYHLLQLAGSGRALYFSLVAEDARCPVVSLVLVVLVSELYMDGMRGFQCQSGVGWGGYGAFVSLLLAGRARAQDTRRCQGSSRHYSW